MSDIYECDYIVGHNIMFDKYVIEAECIKNSMPKPFNYKKKYDTMVMGRSIIKRRMFTFEAIAIKLFGDDLLKKNDIKLHNASSDIWITASIFASLHRNDIKY